MNSDPLKAKRTQVIEGDWLFEEDGPQFQGTLNYEGGKTTFYMDNPTFMGGTGKWAGPMHYCFFGLASCYTGVFATMAEMLGVKLRKLSTRVEADVNFSPVFGLSEGVIMEEVRVKLTVESDEPEEKIREAERLAIQRCPVVYTLKNPVKFTPMLEVTRSFAGSKKEVVH
jgi:uncharacterized OsmC-like protein